MGMFFRKYLATRVRSKRSEKRAAEIFKGRRQPNSGAVNRFDLKGDVKSEKFLVEDKMTDNASYSLKVETWRTLSNQAWSSNRRPAMRIDFTNGPTLYLFDEATALDLMKNL